MDRRQIFVGAMAAARRAHMEFGVDRTDRVDVFSVLEATEADVFFRPLKSICGAYLPSEGPLPAMLINSNMPLSRQRYTAAHELGHVYMKHRTVSLDREVGIVFEERKDLNEEEFAAEAFAAFFLMPKPLVMRSIRELHIEVTQLNPAAVYLLALKMGTSYVATVNQIHTLKLIRWATAARLRNVRPKLIKQELNDAEGSGRHDVWVLDEHWNGQNIFPAPEDTVRIELPEVPTSGYSWLWVERPRGLTVLDDGYKEKEEGIGGARVREFVAQVSSDAQPAVISLQRRRVWESRGKGSAEFKVGIFPQQVRKSGPLVPPRLD